MTPQEPPFAVQLEPTEGCTLACSFCALQSIRENGASAETGTHGKSSPPFRFMEMRTLMRVVYEIKRLGWNPRIEFAMHGEPSVNKELALMVYETRRALPRAYIVVTSNGSGLQDQRSIMALFDAGLNTLALDEYKHAHFVEASAQARGVIEIIYDIPTLHYPDDTTASPHTRHANKRIIVIRDISGNEDGTHQLTNQGGNSFGAVRSLQQRCAKPFRELSVRWDGNVALCCDDWPGVFKVANVHDMKLDDLWNHPRFAAARAYLYAGQRAAVPPCAGCNVRTYRNGLLPDKKGQRTMRTPTLDDHALVQQACAGRQFTIKLTRKDK
jgi:MoaA/NifB/PqqE/SkfB family radical SAM enzyme